MHRNNGEKTWVTIGEILKNKKTKSTATDKCITSNGSINGFGGQHVKKQ